MAPIRKKTGHKAKQKAEKNRRQSPIRRSGSSRASVFFCFPDVLLSRSLRDSTRAQNKSGRLALGKRIRRKKRRRRQYLRETTRFATRCSHGDHHHHHRRCDGRGCHDARRLVCFPFGLSYGSCCCFLCCWSSLPSFTSTPNCFFLKGKNRSVNG